MCSGEHLDEVVKIWSGDSGPESKQPLGVALYNYTPFSWQSSNSNFILLFLALLFFFYVSYKRFKNVYTDRRSSSFVGVMG